MVCLSRDPEARLRDVAADVGITERAVQKIVRDLQDGGMISITKSGRRNCYRIHGKQTLRHTLEADCKLRDLIKVVNRPDKGDGPGQPVKRKPEVGVSPVDPDRKPETKPQRIKPERVSSKPEKDSPEDPGSDGIERQQGSLF